MKVLQQLKESKFYLSKSKLDLFSDKTDCLGHVIDDNGIHTELDKICGKSGNVSGDDLFSALKLSWSFSNSDLRHLQHSSDSDHLPVPETLWSSSYSKSLLVIPNTPMCSFHPSTSPNISSKACSKTSASFEGNLEISSNSAPSDLKSTPTFSRYSWDCNGDRAAPMASDIKGHVTGVICNIKGQGWSGSMGNAG